MEKKHKHLPFASIKSVQLDILTLQPLKAFNFKCHLLLEFCLLTSRWRSDSYKFFNCAFNQSRCLVFFFFFSVFATQQVLCVRTFK